MIFDTDVIIWFLRGNEKAQTELLENQPFSISAVTYMELMQGARDRKEHNTIKKLLETLNVEIIALDAEITGKAIELIEKFHLSNSMEMADALIAATCLITDNTLYTANDKHYKFIDNISIKIFRP